MTQHVNVFVYGTLRTHPDGTEPVLGFTETATRFRGAGDWTLTDYAIYGAGERVPAVMFCAGAKVVGDLYRVTLAGFRSLLQYEHFPSLYQYEEVEVRCGDDRRDAVVFTTAQADLFGSRIPSGDFLNPFPRPQEVPCDLPLRSRS